MRTVGLFFMGLGFLGFFWTLFGSMLVSFVFGSLKNLLFKSPQSKSIENREIIKFDILIAAFNEEGTIAQTLKSFEECTKILGRNKEKILVRAVVGLDHCTDSTLSIVQKFKKTSNFEVSYLENDETRGKWFVLKKLIRASNADWVALTDCGSIWNSELLLKVAPQLRDQELVCIAPSYLPTGAKFLESLYWRLEQFVRYFENVGGGPIMVHGISVFYKRAALIDVLDQLGETHWFNDDVVIPLSLRLNNPHKRIHYLAELEKKTWVYDIGVVTKASVELTRRKRILIGNLQIIKHIILPRFQFFSLASWSSLRLVFKVLWAYWVSFFAIGLLIILETTTLLSDFLSHQSFSKMIVELLFVFTLFIMVKKSNYIHRLFMAYLSGLWIFKGWKALDNLKKISWS
ncbi:MAG: glycosyltransferase [Bacteriovorax sp.]|jgi:glycosyltransferase involved in cell wall biosynthesis|nr:glycosyltransferase [Bacteriovorax sp.]